MRSQIGTSDGNQFPPYGGVAHPYNPQKMAAMGSGNRPVFIMQATGNIYTLYSM